MKSDLPNEDPISEPKGDTTGKPRIVVVATTPFAINSFLLSHLEALSDIFSVTVCVNRGAHELNADLAKNLDVVHIGFERKISFVKDLICLVHLYFVLFRLRPLSVHSITPKAGLLAMLAGFCARVPNRWHTFTGQVWATKKGAFRWMLKKLDRLIVLAATDVFADSASQCRFLMEEGIAPESGIKMLGSGSISGVDLDRFRPDAQTRISVRQTLSVDRDACVFLFVGRLNRDKGVFDLVSAFSQFSSQFVEAELWVVGPDEEGILPELRRLGESSSGTIRWIGATPNPQDFMAAADVLVLPSYREGFGAVVIEAAACGIATIAYRIDGVVDAVVDQETGILIEVGQVGELASTLGKFAQDQDHRTVFGRQARERTEQQFSSKKVTRAWVKFYRDMLVELA